MIRGSGECRRDLDADGRFLRPGTNEIYCCVIYVNIINTVNKTTDMTDKYMIGGILAVLLFQQIYNISMTIGLLPIMGITLPFISYGGSSLISYMILLGFIFNVSNESLRFTN